MNTAPAELLKDHVCRPGGWLPPLLQLVPTVMTAFTPQAARIPPCPPEPFVDRGLSLYSALFLSVIRGFVEYRYAYGAVEPAAGESCFLVLPYCHIVCTDIFLQALSEQYKDDLILLCCDRAAWHKAKDLVIPGITFASSLSCRIRRK